jgi:periplasmic divalent cation tolerance protein
MDFVLVVTTYPVDADAEEFARTLIEERLAACVNVLPPMQSVYRWKGEVEAASERQLLIKTKAANVAALEQRVTALHPYDVPEFLVLSIESGSAAYLACSARAPARSSPAPAPGRPAGPRHPRYRRRCESARR